MSQKEHVHVLVRTHHHGGSFRAWQVYPAITHNRMSGTEKAKELGHFLSRVPRQLLLRLAVALYLPLTETTKTTKASALAAGVRRNGAICTSPAIANEATAP